MDVLEPNDYLSMNKLMTYLLPVAIIIVAVLLYLFIPSINAWVIRMSSGWKGALFLTGAGIVLGVYYALIMGFRGKALGYAIAVIIFTAVCIWLIANWEWFTDLLQTHLGSWGMVGVLLVLCLVVGLGMLFLGL